MNFAQKAAWISVTLLFIFSLVVWVGLNFVGIWGGISVLYLFLLLVLAVFTFLNQRGVISKGLLTNVRLLLFSVGLIFLISEIALRCFYPELKSYGERNGSWTYHSPYHIYLRPCDSCAGSFFINHAAGEEEFSQAEFHYKHRYNSLGLRDHEFTVKKDSNEFRILGLGDSFTEGVGTSADSTWLKQLEYLLNANSSNLHYTTLNAGAHGSDLFFSYDLLTRCLLKYKPNLVILHLNSTDVNDILFRGGYKRYNTEGTYIGKKGPWWEFIFGGSYLARLVILNGLHYNWQLLTNENQQQEETEIVKQISLKINDYRQLALQHHFSFLLVIHPLKEELAGNKNILSGLTIDSAVATIDLTHALNQKINGSTPLLQQYYWPVDGHFTTKGYALDAEEIFRIYFSESR